MVSTVSQIVVVLVNKELSERSANWPRIYNIENFKVAMFVDKMYLKENMGNL